MADAQKRWLKMSAKHNPALPTLASRTSAFEPVTDERESGHDAPISAQFSGGDFPTGGLTDTFPVVEPSGPNGVFTISQPIEEYPTTTIPEPSSVGLCAFGLGGLIIARRSIRQRSS
ncbi:MAG: PEP-CTERM sorting domain-containing protein [Verrucomicrobiota bacterium]